MEYARAAGTPGLLEVNAPLIEEQAVHRGLRDTRGAAQVATRVFQAATALVAVSTEVAAWLERRPSARGRVHVLPNGVDPERFRPDVPPAAPAPPGTFTVGFVGSMKPWHDLPVLIEAFACLHAEEPATRLLLAGGGRGAAAPRRWPPRSHGCRVSRSSARGWGAPPGRTCSADTRGKRSRRGSWNSPPPTRWRRRWDAP